MPRHKPTEDQDAGWDRQLVDQEKRFIKESLDARAGGDSKARLRAALELVGELESDATPVGRLRRFIGVMSALIIHERTLALTPSQVDGLVRIAYAILQVQRIKPRTSRLAGLYGELHQIRSQIFRRTGEPWRAAWEQQVALKLGGAHMSGGVAFQQLCMANRACRLGHAAIAIDQYRAAETTGLEEQHWARHRIELVKCLWLAGRHAEVDEAVAAARRDARMTQEIERELAWIEICRAAQRTGDVNAMLAVTRTGGDFHESTYIIEVTHWALAVESRAFIERLPSMAYLSRKQSLAPKQFGVWFENAKVLQSCYDQDVPLQLRLQALGEALVRRAELVTVDKELLLLAAAVRWLARTRAFELARLILADYESLSLRMTEGRSKDALGVVSDLDGRFWNADAA